MSDDEVMDGTALDLMKQLHKLEVRILQGLNEQQSAWRTELAGVDRRFQTEVHKMMLDVNAKLDAMAKDNAASRAQLVTETVGKRSEDYRALFLALMSFLMSAGMGVLQFMGARLAH